MNLTPVERLALAACQSTTREGLVSYLRSVEGEGTPAEKMRRIFDGVVSMNMDVRDLGIGKRFVQIIREAKDSSWGTWFMSCLGHKPELETVQEELPKYYYVNMRAPSSHLEALCQFMKEFPQHLGATPDAMKGNEIADVLCVSERIWHSENVQSAPDKYAAYVDLMQEDAIGSHLLFEEEGYDTSLLNEIERKAGSPLEGRVSTHYGAVGDQMHKHIRGNLFSETLMFTGVVGVKDDGTVVSRNGKGAYWDKLSPEEQRGAKPMRVTWRQRESYPDGPDWTSWILHRTVDFLRYAFLKNVLKVPRPQVAKYTSVTKGRGLPDNTPVIIQKRLKQRVGVIAEEISECVPLFF